MNFSDFDLIAPLQKAVKDCGFTTPTPVQAETIPPGVSGRDIIGSAQTGTGKTAAFMLPALQRLSNFKKCPKGAPRILVLTPTRELAYQIIQDTKALSKYMQLKYGLLVGGVAYKGQFRALSQPLDLVVATPGRLIDHMNRGSINLDRVEMLVLDEADRMLDMGFKKDVESIAAATPKSRQTLLFTATLNRSMLSLSKTLLKDPEQVDITPRKKRTGHIEQRVLYTDSLTHKYKLLSHVLVDKGLTQAIVFSATKKGADNVAKALCSKGHKSAALHGDMSQAQRNRTVKDLRRGNVRILVATDVASRGLDVAGISHVINFDLPQDAEDYVHRIGRTGRAGASGNAVSFVTPNDLQMLLKIQRYIGCDLPQEVIPGLEPTFSRGAGTANSRKKSGSSWNNRRKGGRKPSWNRKSR